MARLFDDAQQQYLQWSGATPPVTSPPFTLACWARTDTDAVDQTLIWIGDKDTAGQSLGALELLAAEDGRRKVIARTVADNGEAGAAKAWDYSVNTWHHVCGVFAADDDRLVRLDYSSYGSDDTCLTASGVDSTSIGRLGHGTPAEYVSGALAELAVWSAALTDSDIKALAAGYAAPQIRPHQLVSYWPLGGFYGREDRDSLGRYDLTAHNAPSWTEHPPLVYPSRPRMAGPIAPGASRMPWHLFEGRAA
jgi:hypothetical protein